MQNKYTKVCIPVSLSNPQEFGMAANMRGKKNELIEMCIYKNIRKILQREANTTLLTVCPPPVAN